MNYAQVLIDSLRKKGEVLDEIIKQVETQEEALKSEKMDMDVFDAMVDAKGLAIDKLNSLDEGFELVYEHFREELLRNREQYRQEIVILQELIRENTAKGASIEATEARNKILAEQFFANTRQELKRKRTGNRAALNYYENMRKSKFVDPQFMDRKK